MQAVCSQDRFCPDQNNAPTSWWLDYQSHQKCHELRCYLDQHPTLEHKPFRDGSNYVSRPQMRWLGLLAGVDLQFQSVTPSTSTTPLKLALYGCRKGARHFQGFHVRMEMRRLSLSSNAVAFRLHRRSQFQLRGPQRMHLWCAVLSLRSGRRWFHQDL